MTTWGPEYPLSEAAQHLGSRIAIRRDGWLIGTFTVTRKAFGVCAESSDQRTVFDAAKSSANLTYHLL